MQLVKREQKLDYNQAAFEFIKIKTMLIYSCPNCGSSNVVLELNDVDEPILGECENCGMLFNIIN